MKVFLKYLLMARDQPLLFLAFSLPALLGLIVFHTIIFYLIYHSFLNAEKSDNGVVLITVFLVFAPLIPAFFLIIFVFIEYYLHSVFRLLRLHWLFGFQERRLANIIAVWSENKSGAVGEIFVGEK